jgi:uncharacterized protein (DUF934 family)
MKFIDLHHDHTWHSVSGEDGPVVNLTPGPWSLLSLQQWHSVRHHWPKDMPVGVQLPNDAPVDNLEADLLQLSLVTLDFPKWVDGRAYSQARLLRSRYRFTGEIRATGQVLVDMLPLLARTGFDAVELRADQSLDAARRALSFFREDPTLKPLGGHYQGDSHDNRPLFRRPGATP